MTIYSGEVNNNIIINAMVDNNNDIVFYAENKKSFARLSSYEDKNKELKPCIALFKTNAAFEPTYAYILSETYDKYIDNFGRHTDLFLTELEKFWKEAKI